MILKPASRDALAGRSEGVARRAREKSIPGLETLMSLCHSGERLEDLLAAKITGGFAEADFGHWLEDDASAPTRPGRCDYLVERFLIAAKAARISLDLRPGS